MGADRRCIGTSADQARRAHREGADEQHQLRQQFPDGTIGMGDEYSAAIKAAATPESEKDGGRTANLRT